MDPLKIEQLFNQVEAELKRAGSERVQLFYLQKFLVELQGDYATYDSYVIQLFQQLPHLNHPLLFTGFHPKKLKKIISLFEVAIEAIPELSENTEVNRKLQSLSQGLRLIEQWLKIDEGESRNRKLAQANFQKSFEPEAGEVFIPVVESAGSVEPLGRLRKLKVDVVGKTQKNEYELRPVFGVIGANTGNLGERSAKAAGNLLQESVERGSYWKGTAQFELSHAWHAGNSANLALSGLFYCEMLKAENKREYFQLNPGIAITGNVDEYGNVLEVEESTLIQKVEAAFFSWVQVLVVPLQQLELVSTYLEKIEEEFPERNLVLKGVGSLRELYFDRRITLHKQISLTAHTAKKVWKRRNTVGLTLIMIVLLGIIGGLIYGPIDRNPVNIEYAGKYLMLTNKTGLQVGSLEIGEVAAELMDEENWTSPKAILHDINNDGINELIWSSQNRTSTKARTFVQARSVLGDSVIWEQAIRLNYSFPRQHEGAWRYLSVREITTINSEGAEKLVVNASLSSFFANIVMLMNLTTGEIEQEYVHIGHLKDMVKKDINGDNNEEIILTGVNNAFWKAVVVVLDPTQINGHSPLTEDYQVQNMQRAKEMYYILIPKTVVGDYISNVEKYNQGRRISVDEESETLWVEVYETTRKFGSKTEYASIYVFLNYNMQATGFGTSDLHDIIARELFESGEISSTPNYDYFQNLTDSLLYWDGQEFVHKPTTNKKYAEEIESK